MFGRRFGGSRGGGSRGPAGSLALLVCGALLLGGCGGSRPMAEVPASPDQGPRTAAASGPSTTPAPTTAPAAEAESTPTAQPTASPEPEQATPTAVVWASAEDVQRIGPAEAKALLDAGQAVLYDVRSPESYQASRAAAALSLPASEIDSLLPTLPRDQALILYCT